MSGRGRRLIAALLAAGLAFTACTRDDENALTPPTVTSGTAPADQPQVVVDGSVPGDEPDAPAVHLSDGGPAPIRRSGVPVVTGDPLTDDELAAALGRLPEWVVPPDDQSGFERPAERLGPPLVGEQVDTPFPPPPPPAEAEPPAAGDLHVVRFQPEGDVDVAPFLSVTFDQPMVPVTTLDQLEAADVPVVLTPPVEGRWRWIGTRTVRFEVVPGDTDRLPAATEYAVEVPAGTTSANGAELAEAVTWAFATPAPTVTEFVGAAEAMPTVPVFVAVFDQVVDPAAVLATVTVTAADAAVGLRLATADEVEADDAARAAVGGALAGRAVAFVPEAPLPTDAQVEIAIGPGTPSAEGPLTTTEAATFSGHTYGPLEVVEHRCGWDDAECTPGSALYVRFNNPLDVDGLTPAQVSQLITAEPAIPALRLSVYGNEVEIAGATAAHTTYTVTLDAALADVFGQTLGSDQQLTFDIGPARPSLAGLDRPFVTTDPMADRPTVSVTTVNHASVHVTAWAVTAAELGEFREYSQRFTADTAPAAPDWPVALDVDVTISPLDDRPVETLIDLTDAFARSGSQLVVLVEPTEAVPTNSPDYWANRPRLAWVQRTTLGIDAFSDGSRMVIWTSDLTTGEPVGQVPVELLGDGRVATTDDDGLAEIELGSAVVTGLFGNAGDRTALLAPEWWSDGWAAHAVPVEGRWFVFDDRGIYKPGETLRVAGWVRRLERAADTLLGLFGDAGDAAERTLAYTIRDAQGNELATASVPLNALGGFNLSAELPTGSNLGPATVEMHVTGPGVPADGVWYLHQFQIQEFRTPEFEVTARAETPAPYFQAEPATVAVDAAYYAGGPLPDAEVDWSISTTTTTYAPPGWDEYHFGEFRPWWWAGDHAAESAAASVAFGLDCFDCPGGDVDHQQFSGRTDANGTHFLEIAIGADGDSEEPSADLPRAVTAEATVFDVNRQAWSSRVDLLVHAARHYVGLHSDRAFVEQGTPIRVDAVVTDVDGAALPGRAVTVTAGRVEWSPTGTEQVVDEQTCELTSSDAAERCEFATDLGGEYRVTATVADDTGHRNRTELTVWVSGGTRRPARNVEQEQVTIVPATDELAPGETAELLVQAPFAPATGVYTVMRGSIREAHTFDAPDGSARITIPVDDADVPELTLEFEMVGTAPRLDDAGNPAPDAPDRPAFATGRITLPVSPVDRELTVTATPAAEAVEPGADTSVTVSVAGPDGAPVAGADVAVVVVDEAVLALTGYELADPLDVFYAPLGDAVQALYGRSSIVLTRSDAVVDPAAPTAPDGTQAATAATMPAGAPGDDDSAALDAVTEEAAGGAARSATEQQTAPIELRENFDALAVFAPTEVTAADGTVTVAVPLPDSLTRYRVMAVAVDGPTRFGKGESSITARRPLMARPSAPRFLNFGDRFELPVVLQNQTDQEIVVDVAVEVANLELAGPVGQRVTVPAADRVEVRFPATTVAAGTARYRVVAVSADAALGYADAVAGELPVYTPATAEAFATYGVLDGTGDPTAPAGVSQPVVAPTGVFPQFGGLELTTSSTALQALTDAVLYLSDYPYRSADGHANRVIAIATLRDVLTAFQADGLPAPEALDAAVADDLAGLSALQNDDGGWAWWQRGMPSDPWVTVGVAHALVVAEQAGYPVDRARLDRALAYLASIEQFLPSDWPDSVRWTVRAYAIHVRGAAGQRDPAKAAELYAEAGEALQLDALAWLWPSLDDPATRSEVEQTLLNRAVDTAGAVTFATDYGESGYLIAQSDRRTDAIVLDALITQAPASELIPKVVAGLLAGQTEGRWNNAYENAFVLVALNRYFRTFEDVTPDFVARAWLGDTYVSEHAFQGRSTDRAHTRVPTQQLIDTAGEFGAAPLVLQNDGTGRMYYRLGMRYAPASLVLDARDEGFVVDRIYEPVDDPSDVTRDADGTWHIRAGALVRVRLTMVADAVRTHVALVDPLPAGLEAVNPELAVGQTIPPPAAEPAGDVPARGATWWGTWYEHQNLGDDRVEAFAGWLPGGTYEYTYVARATTPGEFVTPPARAEEIYAPEVFGRSPSTRVVITDQPP